MKIANKKQHKEAGQPLYQIERYGQRYFALRDQQGELVAVTVYKKGAKEIARRLTELAEKLAKREQNQPAQ